MGFEQVQHILPELMEQAVKDNLSFSDFLERVLKKEREYREERRIKTSLKLSGLPHGKTLENFDFTFQRSVGKKEIELLATCEYVRRKENVLLLGPPGVGKSHLAAALGVKAVQNGFSVSWLPKVLETVDLMILDELSYVSFTKSQSELLFHALSARNEKGSVMITTNLEFSKWTELFPDPVLAAAMIDRITHRSHILDMNGASYRLAETKRRKAKESGSI